MNPTVKQMIVRKATRNRITLPLAIASCFSDVEYFDVKTDGERIIMRPLQRNPGAKVRGRLSKLGIDEKDVAKAIAWARH
jgi:hypothetical protein